MQIRLYNTLTRKKEEFKPLKKGHVSMYHCGPTVYDYAHIGNLRSYIFADVLRRVLEYNGYEVKQVINITDVGHLTSDSDTGEDKVEKAARREKKTTAEIISYYTNVFFDDLGKLNIKTDSTIFPRASAHIKEQIELISKLEKKDFVYKISDGVYFDTSRVEQYAKLAHSRIEGLREGARVEKNLEKRNPTDFAVWKFSPEKSSDQGLREQEWESPWGVGFPGWHLECSAMSMKYLGETIDIHTGGIDHIPIHHTNEIAQSESATGKQFVRYWVHNEFITVSESKMAKSLGNIFTLKDVVQKGFSPLSYRYFILTAHYRTLLNFTWDALHGSQIALNKLNDKFLELKNKKGVSDKNYIERFRHAIDDDLDTPKAIALLWELVKDSKLKPEDKRETMIDFDSVLGLGFLDIKRKPIPEEVLDLVEKRELARKKNDWEKADIFREEIFKKGYAIKDTSTGPTINPVQIRSDPHTGDTT